MVLIVLCEHWQNQKENIWICSLKKWISHLIFGFIICMSDFGLPLFHTLWWKHRRPESLRKSPKGWQRGCHKRCSINTLVGCKFFSGMTSASHWLSCQSKAQLSVEEVRKADGTGHTNISFIVCLWANRSHQGSSVPLPVCVCAQSLQLCSTLCNPMDFPRLLCPWVFSRQEHWSGLPFTPPGDLPNPGMEPMSLMSPALAGRFFTTSTT